MPDKAVIIIVNWNGKDLLKDCLPSVLKQSYPDYGILVVDNGSTDGSVDYLRAHFPLVQVLALPENAGFARGNNLGIKESFADKETDYIALLNNDTIVEPEWLQELITAMNQDARIGICASKMLQMNNPRIIDSTGHTFGRWGILIDRGEGETDQGQYDVQKEIIGACAGACLYRRSMLEAIGLFDERFGSYYEDAELSWRAYQEGWKSYFVPTARVYHKRGGTSKKDRFIYQTMTYQGLINVITTLKKYGTVIQKTLFGLYLIKRIIGVSGIGYGVKRLARGRNHVGRQAETTPGPQVFWTAFKQLILK